MDADLRPMERYVYKAEKKHPKKKKRHWWSSTKKPPKKRNSWWSFKRGAEVGLLPAHPNLLVRPALTADAAGHIAGVGAVPEVATSGSCQSHLKRRRPVLVGFGESPHLVRCQAKITE